MQKRCEHSQRTSQRSRWKRSRPDQLVGTSVPRELAGGSWLSWMPALTTRKATESAANKEDCSNRQGEGDGKVSQRTVASRVADPRSLLPPASLLSPREARVLWCSGWLTACACESFELRNALDAHHHPDRERGGATRRDTEGGGNRVGISPAAGRPDADGGQRGCSLLLGCRIRLPGPTSSCSHLTPPLAVSSDERRSSLAGSRSSAQCPAARRSSAWSRATTRRCSLSAGSEATRCRTTARTTRRTAERTAAGTGWTTAGPTTTGDRAGRSADHATTATGPTARSVSAGCTPARSRPTTWTADDARAASGA